MWKTFRIYYQHRVSLTSGMFLISVQIFWSGKLIQQTVSVSLFSQWRSRGRCGRCGRSAPGGRHPGCATVSSVKSFVSYCHWYDHFIYSTMWRWNYVWADISFLQTATFNSKGTKITNPANPDYSYLHPSIRGSLVMVSRLFPFPWQYFQCRVYCTMYNTQ